MAGEQKIDDVALTKVINGYATSGTLPNGDNLGGNDKKNQQKMREEIKRLRSTNALYDKYEPEWQFYLDSHEGGVDYLSPEKKNLFRHPREHEEDFRERLERAHYANYCEPLCSFFTDYIFQETIQRNGGTNDEFYSEFKLDVNRKGENIDTFMKQVCDDMQILGMSYVMVDTPAVPDDFVGKQLTMAQQKQLGIRPYWVLIKPLEVFDWVTDDFDRFVYLKRVQISESYVSGTRRQVERYTEWDEDTVKVSEIDITNPNRPQLLPAQMMTNPVGRVPFNVFRYRRSKKDPYIGVSFLVDIARENRSAYNLTSLMDEFLYRQCFNILAMEADQTITHREQEEGESGTANVLIYPNGGKTPQYIAPHSEPADKIDKERAHCINEMYRRASQDTMNELRNGGGASGFSKNVNFSKTVPKIASRADVLEQGEIALMQLVMAYKDKTWDGKIKYKDRYEITNLTDALQQLLTIFKDLQMESETFAKEQLKRIVHEYDGKLPPDVLTKVETEIDAMDYDEYFNSYKLAFLGRAAMSAEIGTAFSPDQVSGSEQSTTPSPTTDQATQRAPKTKSNNKPPADSATNASQATKSKKPGGRNSKKQP